MREFLAICLKRSGHEVTTVDSVAAAIHAVADREYDLVLTDLRLGDQDGGLRVLEVARSRTPETQVIVVTAYASTETAIAAMKRGAYDYLTKPFKLDEIAVVIDRALEKRALVVENEQLKAELEGRNRLGDLLGKSAAMQRVFELAKKVAPTRTNVLITGESGTGKELVARALHFASTRAKAPFVAINCGAIPEALLESELFGHVKGSFTGATTDRQGLFLSADSGTLFLDEIGELAPSLQVKLLRVLQERRVKPVGGTQEREIDVRVVAATNRDLEGEVARGTFRQDLFYRLNVIEIRLPPLRHRREDIPMLVDHFVGKYSREHDKAVRGVSKAALAALCDYDFPGNIRELENLVERAIALESTGELQRDSFPALRTSSRTLAAASASDELPADGIDLDRVLGDLERDLLLKALRRSEGVRNAAARILGITFRSLRYRLAKHAIAMEESSTDEAAPPEPLANSRELD
jgi:two-component system response regulator PilR (NtrC family)